MLNQVQWASSSLRRKQWAQPSGAQASSSSSLHSSCLPTMNSKVSTFQEGLTLNLKKHSPLKRAVNS